MAGAGYKLFNTGDVLTAAQVNTYLNEQTVMVFASSAARTTALSGVLAEGMMSYLQDTNAVEVYNGSAWVSVGGGGGDLTEIQAGVGISVASGTGPIPIITNSSTDLITTAGDLLYGTAADTMARLGIGTAGQVLKVNSGATAPEWGAAAGGGGGLVYLTGATFTAVTSVSLPNNTFTTTYDWYQIHLSVTSTANVSPTGRLRASGSDDTNNSYYNGGRSVNIGSSATDTSASGTSFSLGQMNTNNTYMGKFLIGNPKVAKRTFLEYGISTIESGNTYFQVLNGTGGFSATTAFDSFSFIFGSNCTGNYTVYGYALS